MNLEPEKIPMKTLEIWFDAEYIDIERALKIPELAERIKFKGTLSKNTAVIDIEYFDEKDIFWIAFHLGQRRSEQLLNRTLKKY